MPAAIDRILDRGKCRITTKPIQQWRIGREMNRRIKKTFDARGIEIPFPHQTLYWGAAKDGTAPPPPLPPRGRWPQAEAAVTRQIRRPRRLGRKT